MKTTQKEVSILAHTVVKDVYVACDGKEFYDIQQCRSHEYSIMIKKIKAISSDILYPFVTVFYFIETDEILEFLINREFGGKNKTTSGKLLEVGDWATCYYQYNSEYADDYEVMTLDELYKGFRELLGATGAKIE